MMSGSVSVTQEVVLKALQDMSRTQVLVRKEGKRTPKTLTKATTIRQEARNLSSRLMYLIDGFDSVQVVTGKIS